MPILSLQQSNGKTRDAFTCKMPNFGGTHIVKFCSYQEKQDVVIALKDVTIFSLSLLGWHRLIKYDRFQMCNSITHHLSIVTCVHNPKSSRLSSPFIPPLLSSPSHLLFSGNHPTVTCSEFFSFLAFTFFSQLLNPLPSDRCQAVLCINESVSILLVTLFCSLNSIYKWNHMVLFCLWLAYFT